MLLALYASQYFGIGFLMTGATAVLREKGVALESLAAVSALGMLWAVKFLWAPVVDRFGRNRKGGHYRSWLLVLQPLLACVLIAIGCLPDVRAQFGIFLLLTAVYIFLSATQDVAADALAISSIHSDERGFANGVQVAGSYIGLIVGGGLTTVIYGWAGWFAALVTLAILTLLPTVLIAVSPEPPASAEARATRVSVSTIWTVVRQPGAGIWMLLVVPTSWMGLTAGYSLITPSLIDEGWSAEETASLTTLLAGVCGTVAALGTGMLIQRFGRERVLLIGSSLAVLGMVAFIPVISGAVPTIYIIATTIVFFLGYTAGSILVYSINMDYSRPGSAGSDYTTLASFAMLVSFGAGAVSLSVAGQLGYVSVFFGSSILYAIGAALIVWHQRRYRTQMLNHSAGRDVLPVEPVTEGSGLQSSER
nr:MFS transporter [Corynebacterium sp. Marseille-P3884]